MNIKKYNLIFQWMMLLYICKPIQMYQPQKVTPHIKTLTREKPLYQAQQTYTNLI